MPNLRDFFLMQLMFGTTRLWPLPRVAVSDFPFRVRDGYLDGNVLKSTKSWQTLDLRRLPQLHHSLSRFAIQHDPFAPQSQTNAFDHETMHMD